MNILALDLGTSTGFAYNVDDTFHCGTKLLATKQQLAEQKRLRFERRMDRRVMELFRWVRMVAEGNHIELIVFEDVLFSSTTYQTQLWASLRAAVWLACPANVGTDCIAVGSLKKFAGHGGATKEMMACFLARADDRFFIGKEKKLAMYFRNTSTTSVLINDDAVDAVWIWKWATENLSRLR